MIVCTIQLLYQQRVYASSQNSQTSASENFGSPPSVSPPPENLAARILRKFYLRGAYKSRLGAAKGTVRLVSPSEQPVAFLEPQCVNKLCIKMMSEPQPGPSWYDVSVESENEQQSAQEDDPEWDDENADEQDDNDHHSVACKLFRRGTINLARHRKILAKAIDCACFSCGDYPIHSAAAFGDVEVVQLLCSLGANLETRNIGGETPLVVACLEGRLALVSYLLESGVDPCQADDGGRAPLLIAFENRHKEIIELLLKHGADPNILADPEDNVTILHKALKRRMLGVASMLIDAGAEVDPVTVLERETPILTAVEVGATNVFKQLVKKGANLRRVFARGKNLLHVACSHGQDKIVRSLLKLGLDPNSRDDHMMNALHLVARTHRVGLAELLIGYGCKVNDRDMFNHTPLDVAVINNQPAMVECLFDRRAVSNDIGEAFVKCVRHSRKDIVVMLGQKGMGVNSRDGHGVSPLRAALEVNDIEIMDILIRLGANPNEECANGQKPLLTEAVLRNQLGAVRVLVHGGADIAAFDDDNQPAMFHAIRMENAAIIKVIADAEMAKLK